MSSFLKVIHRLYKYQTFLVCFLSKRVGEVDSKKKLPTHIKLLIFIILSAG